MAFWTQELEEQYRQVQLEQVRRNYLMLVKLGLVIVPLFGISDWLAYRDSFSSLLVIRVSIFTAFVFFHLLGRCGVHPGGPVVAGTTLMNLSAIAITAMCWVTGGHHSTYYAGINLLTLAVVIVFSGNFRHASRSIATMNGIYLAAMILRDGLPADALAAFSNNAVFMAATSCMALMSVRLSEDLHRRSFLRMLDAGEAARLRASRDAAEHALEVRDEFIAIASHELNTPLTSMKLNNDVLKQQLRGADSPSPELTRAWTERNDKSLRRLIRLVEDMLDISRITAGKLQLRKSSVDLGDLVADACENQRVQMNAAGIELRFSECEKVVGNWDATRIEQVVTNLLSNAIKYAPRAPLEVTVRSENGKALLEVRDRGPGISSENRQRIFERFERATPYRKASGLGLGLYISRHIVEGHGGTIRVKENDGPGTIFVVELPLEQMAQVPVVERVPLLSRSL